MNSQLKAIRVESKGKTATKVSAAVDELQFLQEFNSSVCQAMAKSMEHLTEFVFVNMANTTLLRRDSYLAYLKAGVKADTLHALLTAPLQSDTLCSRTVWLRGQRKTLLFLIRVGPAQYTKEGDITPMRGRTPRLKVAKIGRLGKICPALNVGNRKAGPSTHPDWPRVSSSVNDNQCVTQLKPLLLTGSPTGKTLDTHLNVKLDLVHFAHTAPAHSQKNEISPGAAGCSYKKDTLKPVKSVSCVIPLSYVNPVLNAPNVVSNLPVGARLQKFWKNWVPDRKWFKS